MEKVELVCFQSFWCFCFLCTPLFTLVSSLRLLERVVHITIDFIEVNLHIVQRFAPRIFVG